MKMRQIDGYFRGILDIDGFAGCDSSLNGIQVDNDGAEIGKIAFAVDACLETFRRAKDAGAGMLFVHHGLFWGNALPVSGGHRARVKYLLENNIALYAAHLPLDQHEEVGNNAGLARLLGLEGLEPFGLYHGRKIGYKGHFAQGTAIEEAARRIAFMGRPPAALFPFGKKENLSCAVISGGAAHETAQAIDEGIDLYVTGEAAHEVYHTALEASLNMIAGGHYSTEVWGPQALMKKCADELGIAAEFIDVPTGL
jgi:dinuclear metal center YbgI/SA1388 family protein